jgi:hypothetical protein
VHWPFDVLLEELLLQESGERQILRAKNRAVLPTSNRRRRLPEQRLVLWAKAQLPAGIVLSAIHSKLLPGQY